MEWTDKLWAVSCPRRGGSAGHSNLPLRAQAEEPCGSCNRPRNRQNPSCTHRTVKSSSPSKSRKLEAQWMCLHRLPLQPHWLSAVPAQVSLQPRMTRGSSKTPGEHISPLAPRWPRQAPRRAWNSWRTESRMQWWQSSSHQWRMTCLREYTSWRTKSNSYLPSNKALNIRCMTTTGSIPNRLQPSKGKCKHSRNSCTATWKIRTRQSSRCLSNRWPKSEGSCLRGLGMKVWNDGEAEGTRCLCSACVSLWDFYGSSCVPRAFSFGRSCVFGVWLCATMHPVDAWSRVAGHMLLFFPFCAESVKLATQALTQILWLAPSTHQGCEVKHHILFHTWPLGTSGPSQKHTFAAQTSMPSVLDWVLPRALSNIVWGDTLCLHKPTGSFTMHGEGLQPSPNIRPEQFRPHGPEAFRLPPASCAPPRSFRTSGSQGLRYMGSLKVPCTPNKSLIMNCFCSMQSARYVTSPRDPGMSPEIGMLLNIQHRHLLNWKMRGSVICKIANQEWGYPIRNTCKAATRKDYCYISREL